MRISVNFYLTWNCNFHCDHCIHECGPTGVHMTDEEFRYGIGFLNWLCSRNTAPNVIGLTGGEPTLHPKFWDMIVPQVANTRANYKLQMVELHTNGSIPVPDYARTAWGKFFSNIWIGHDMFHRKFKPLSELYLQDYSDISQQVTLRYANGICYVNGEPREHARLRMKGRAAEMVPSGKYEIVPYSEYPKQECIFNNPEYNMFVINFTPGRINFCGETSHTLPDYTGGKAFGSYSEDFDTILGKTFQYQAQYSHTNCLQKCMVSFVTPKKPQ